MFINYEAVLQQPKDKSIKVSILRQIDKQNVVYAYKEILPTVFKRNEILTHATTWMNLEDVVLNEIIQSQRNKYSMIPLI